MKEQFFQCVFLLAETESALMSANKLCRQHFGHSTEGEYMPHLSLVYGNHPMELRQQLQAKLSEELPTLSQMEVAKPGFLVAPPITFAQLPWLRDTTQVTGVSLWRTDVPSEEKRSRPDFALDSWYEVVTVPLGTED